jgi:hypothetical protein
MKRFTHRNRVAYGLLGLLALGAWLVMAVQPAFPGESQSASSGQTQTGANAGASQPPAAVPEGASGMIIYIDPQTGALLHAPAPGTVPLQLTPALRNALSTSHQGLVETPSAVPGGGVKVDLQGRFQSPLVATIDANGNLRIQHLHEMPESGHNK